MTTGLADFFKYNLWANRSLLDVCANLSDEQLDATMDGTYGSIRETFIHLIASEEGYVYRFTGQRANPPLYEYTAFPGFDELRRRANTTGDGLIALARQWEQEQSLQLTYQGQVYEVPAILVLIQAITHAADHRSQIATLLTRQQITPPEIDSWGYFHSLR